MDKAELSSRYPGRLEAIMDEYHPSSLISENFNVEIHGNSVDTHYHHGALTNYSPYLDRNTISSGCPYGGHGSDLGKTSFTASRGVEHQNIEFYSNISPNVETDFRAHVDYGNQVVAASDVGRNSFSPERFQQLADETKKEIEAAATAVENLGYNFIQDVKAVFHDLNAQLQESHTQWLKETIYGNSNAAVKDDIITNLTEMLQKEKEKNETQRETGHLQIEEMKNKHEEFNMKLAEKFHNRNVKQKTINGLRTNMLTSWKQKCEEENKRKTEDTCQQLRAKYAAAQEKLEEEIAKIKQEQAKLAQEKAEYESAIQQGLIKGLCCLNMEAMKVFKLKLDSSGTNMYPSVTEESNCAYDSSQPHITAGDSENPLGLSSSLVVIMENTKDNARKSSSSNIPTEVDQTVKNSTRQTPPPNKPIRNEQTDVSGRKSKNLKLPPNYQVVKLMKKQNSAISTKRKL